MPKHEIDYSNTIIYKITCNDSTISDLYVGHTTNFVQRKHSHKQTCINEKNPNYKCKLYEIIRNHGGWENWKMEIINCFNCKNHYEARKKEQEYMLSLNATLNSNEPYLIPNPKEIIVKNKVIKEILQCKECNKYFNNINLLETHNKTNKHIKNLDNKLLIKKSPKSSKKFICEICEYKCSKKSDFEKHLLTSKHFKLINVNEQLIQKSHILKCSICHKEYKSNVGLWKHKKKCIPSIIPEENIILDASSNEMKVLSNLVLEVIKNNSELQKQNQDLQQKMYDLCKNNNTMINSNNNNHNKTFNLQFFLNEECKDAMNMSEFINSIELKLSDLENFGKVGYVEGMSNIIIKKLNNTDMYKRPVHCSDAKRETLYVKEENKWEKEGPENSKMVKAVYSMNKKNYQMLNVWKEAHPNCLDGQTKQCDDYMKIMCKVMDGDKENINKVIKRLAKEVVIHK